MNVTEAILSRRSIRAYTAAPVSDEDLQAVLRAANAAPVGMKRYEDVHLTVIRDEALLGKINAACADFMGRPDAQPLYGAPVFLIVSAKINQKMAAVGYANAAILVQNMALQAVELGLGACHIWGALAAINSTPELLAELKLPEGFVPAAGLIIGHFDGEYALRDVPLDRVSTNYIG